ncbi:MAG TPA: DUF5050 domain-containing protein [Firmicutes bacterium]|nr:DUF5050 domain-containing protein [Bacillota bacterium]
MKFRKRIVVVLSLLIVILILAILCLLLWRGGSRRYDRQIELGRTYLSEGNYGEAELAFRAAIEIEPARTPAYMGLSDTYQAADTENGWRKAAEVLCEGIAASREEVLVEEALKVGEAREDRNEKEEVLAMVEAVWPELPRETIDSYWGEEQESGAEGSEETETEPEAIRETAAESSLGNIAGNLNNGGYAAETEDYVFYCFGNALWRADRDGNGQIMLYDGACSSLNIWEDRIYFLAEEEKEQENYYRSYTERTPFCMELDGSGLTQIGETVSDSFVTYEFGSSYYEDYAESAGYRGFTVCDGYIYYIGRNGRTGSYSCTVSFSGSSEERAVTYRDNNSIYRMNLDGSGVTELIGNIGNASPQLCVAEGSLYYTISYMNAFYSPYDFTRFCRAKLDGSGIEELPVSSDWNQFNSDFGNYAQYVLGIQVMDGKLYVSCGDSQGEFPDSRLHVYDASVGTLGDRLLPERCWNKTVAFGGDLYVSAGEREEYDILPVTGRALAVCGTDGQLIRTLKTFDESVYGGNEYYNNLSYEINVTEDWVYYRIGGGGAADASSELGRISPDGTVQEILASGT